MKLLAADFRLLLDFMARMPGPVSMVWLIAGLLLGWWVYVPIHELLHVFGCVAAGGSVSRLELAPLYGGALLENWLPFVVSGSDYAGQLTGFDTRGSDWIYQACVLMPYVITVFPGFWLWQRALALPGTPGAGRLLAAGALLPLVAAPLISLTGDYYESGSIVVSGVASAMTERDASTWRSDDIFRLVGEWPGPMTIADALIIFTGLLLSIVLALATMLLGSWLGRRLGLPGLSEVPETAKE